VQAGHRSKNVRVAAQIKVSHHHTLELTQRPSLFAKVIY
jgi:hypothetical protein